MLPYGLKIDTASSGFEAIDKIKNGAVYDIIFVDYMMPQMDGLEAIRQIRNLGYENSIVILTANVAKGQEEVFITSGSDDYMHKPIDIRELNTLLNRLIRDKQPPAVIEAARQEMKKQKADADFNLAYKVRMYNELVSAVVRDAENAILVLEDILKNINDGTDVDLLLYTTTVHGMKSPLANLGETVLSRRAHILEQAGSIQDFDVILDETPDFINALQIFINNSNPPAADNDTNASEDDIMILRDKLNEIQSACKAYDIKTAKIVLSELKNKTWPKETIDKINEISWELTRGDFNKVISTIETIKAGL
jgi:CheY-like chemotaxis protein